MASNGAVVTGEQNGSLKPGTPGRRVRVKNLQPLISEAPAIREALSADNVFQTLAGEADTLSASDCKAVGLQQMLKPAQWRVLKKRGGVTRQQFVQLFHRFQFLPALVAAIEGSRSAEQLQRIHAAATSCGTDVHCLSIDDVISTWPSLPLDGIDSAEWRRFGKLTTTKALGWTNGQALIKALASQIQQHSLPAQLPPLEFRSHPHRSHPHAPAKPHPLQQRQQEREHQYQQQQQSSAQHKPAHPHSTQQQQQPGQQPQRSSPTQQEEEEQQKEQHLPPQQQPPPAQQPPAETFKVHTPHELTKQHAEAERTTKQHAEAERTTKQQQTLPESEATVQQCGWHQTSDCHWRGRREPEQDLPCSEVVPAGASGYCVCNGRVSARTGCNHGPFRCADYCSHGPGGRVNREQVKREEDRRVKTEDEEIREQLRQLRMQQSEQEEQSRRERAQRQMWQRNRSNRFGMYDGMHLSLIHISEPTRPY
eukprot:TRINITY_DN8624_c0_g1_i2.p1 TRINITY_DN8624_c0_g1~~TRINITY_DN8624_c0_g1_i2.p1  ORF type:complete len:480 (+),score=122.88 TRINITY_DN8624_c0_g1_i2:266-1705(+)